MGQRLADSLGLAVDDKVNLTVINANGQPDTASFTLRGLFATGVPTYDENAVFMPLAKAQAFTGASEPRQRHRHAAAEPGCCRTGRRRAGNAGGHRADLDATEPGLSGDHGRPA